MKNFIHKSNNITDLLNLLIIIVNNIKKGINYNIWDIWNNYSSVSLDILNPNNSFMEYYHIDNLFAISYTNIKTCLFCFKIEIIDKNAKPLIPLIIAEMLNFSSLPDILYNKLGVTKNACFLCYYN